MGGGRVGLRLPASAFDPNGAEVGLLLLHRGVFESRNRIGDADAADIPSPIAARFAGCSLVGLARVSNFLKLACCNRSHARNNGFLPLLQ